MRTNERDRKCPCGRSMRADLGDVVCNECTVKVAKRAELRAAYVPGSRVLCVLWSNGVLAGLGAVTEGDGVGGGGASKSLSLSPWMYTTHGHGIVPPALPAGAQG